ncbi:hypothetical protein [Kordiimonas sp.]|uniref:hypothetical protein n=1 Tax=Kordiimonas sp. TaxID=1970157 RepID=UPI003B51A9D0
MSNKAVLEHAASYFKAQYPGLTAEAIICFLVVVDLNEPTVGDVARAVGMTEPQAYQHISMLTPSGAGIIQLQNEGDGRNIVLLTEAGLAAKAAIEAALK